MASGPAAVGPDWAPSPAGLWRASGAGPFLRLLAVVLVVGALALAGRPAAGALDTARLQQAAQAAGPRAERAARELRDVVARGLQTDEGGRLELVNGFVNRSISFAEDQVVWGQADYWASPLEAMTRGQGDCEDYAIAKYFMLLASGLPVTHLRLVYVRAVMPLAAGGGSATLAHMVLAYYADNDAEPLILDNLVTDIRPASRRTDLTPVFSFNGEGLWASTGGRSAGDPQARLSRWRDVLAKARAEGFE